MMPPTPAPDLPLPKAARVINIITALTGVVASGLLGFCAIFMGKTNFRPKPQGPAGGRSSR